MFRTDDGISFVEDTSICDGTVAEIIALRSCTIDNYDFNGAPFNLAWGSSIYAIVIATNIKGSSASSAEGNGAVILRVPDAPTSLADAPDITSNS